MGSLNEFEDCLFDPNVRGHLAALGIGVKDAKGFFVLLQNLSGCDELKIDDVVEHCAHIKGMASSLDLAALSFEVKTMHDLIRSMAVSPGGMDATPSDQPRRTDA